MSTTPRAKKPNGSNGKSTPSNGNGNNLDPNNGAVQVVVRLRPLNEREKKFGTLPVLSASTGNKTVTVIKGKGDRQARSNYSFDQVFTAFSTQEEVFENTIQPVLEDVLMGYESTVFAYGQTGTGKTHTMEGLLDTPDNYGVIPRAANSIFEKLKATYVPSPLELDDDDAPEPEPVPLYESFQIFCSYLEIYNEDLCDLLADDNGNSNTTNNNSPSKRNGAAKLEIMEGQNGVFCRNLSETQVHNSDELLAVMRKAQNQRKVGETNMNKRSSRSHCIFTLRVEAKKHIRDTGAILETRGKLHMVDLAGSENAKAASLDDAPGANNDAKKMRNTQQQAAARERERMNINRSLLTLGRVVKLLKEQSNNPNKTMRIPYRDSKLTRILQNALGGNSKTVIFATLSPSVTALEESISTLNYAQAAHGIINKPKSAAYLTEASPTKMAALASVSGDDQQRSLEHWNEMEIRLEYLKGQVEEAKAALARKHMQQQVIIDRAEAAEAEVRTINKTVVVLEKKNVGLEKDLKKSQDLQRETASQLKETRTKLVETTLILQATQKTEKQLTTEANDLMDALKNSIADGDELHAKILENREAEVKRRQAAQQFNTCLQEILKSARDSLQALAEKEREQEAKTKELATTAAQQDNSFLDETKELLEQAMTNVETAVTGLKTHLNEELVPAAEQNAQEVTKNLQETQANIQASEDKLSGQFQSTKEKLTQFGTELAELERQHEAASAATLQVLQVNVTESREKLTDLISSSKETMDANFKEREEHRQVTKESMEHWKESLIWNGEVLLDQSTTHHARVEETAEKMKDETMPRHENLDNQLVAQNALLGAAEVAIALQHKEQQEMLDKTQATAEEANKQQTALLDVFVQRLMKDVKALVVTQVAEVTEQVKQGHKEYLENNQKLMDNHSAISVATNTALTGATALNVKIKNDTDNAKDNDEAIMHHLHETSCVFEKIESTVRIDHTRIVEDGANNAMTHLQESIDLDEKQTKELHDKLAAGQEDCVEHLSTNVQGLTTQEISTKLVPAGQAISTFAKDTVLDQMTTAVNEMEEPRGEVMSKFNGECKALEELTETGLTQIKEKSSETSTQADDLHSELKKSVENEWMDKKLDDRLKAIKESQQTFATSSTEHADFAVQSIEQTTENSNKVESTTDEFCKSEHVAAYEPVEEAKPRTEIKYSPELTATPEDDEILHDLKMEEVAGTVLQSLSLNHDEIIFDEKSHSSAGSINGQKAELKHSETSASTTT